MTTCVMCPDVAVGSFAILIILDSDVGCGELRAAWIFMFVGDRLRLKNLRVNQPESLCHHFPRTLPNQSQPQVLARGPVEEIPRNAQVLRLGLKAWKFLEGELQLTK